MTPKEMFSEYVEKFCTNCEKNVDCELHITSSNEVKCVN